MHLRRTITNLNWWMIESFRRRPLSLRTMEATVSFTFDDFPRTAYTNAGAILRAYNGRGTYYTAMGLMETTNELGPHFRVQDLRGLVSDGHELANHTFSHLSCRGISTDAYVKDVCRDSAALADFVVAAAGGNFSYPFGHITIGAKGAIGSRMRSCRGTRGGINGPVADLNALKANRLYSWCFDLETVQRLILETQERGGWLIFYTHDVRDDPSPYGCTPRQFEAVVKHVAERGIRILTIAETLADLERRGAA